jgi:acyl-coenzyme A thioesterase PaaI-like protein
MPIDLADVREGLSNTVPMIATLGITFEDLSYDRAVLVLPDAVEYHNHIGGLHAGAMFTLAESATAAIIFANFGDIPDVVTPQGGYGSGDGRRDDGNVTR